MPDRFSAVVRVVHSWTVTATFLAPLDSATASFHVDLTFTTLWANLADNKWMMVFLFFPENRL